MNPWKILLAEDDSDDQKLFCDFLLHRTDIVLMPVAENGAEALEILERTTDEELPDLIILDQNMPWKAATMICSNLLLSPPTTYRSPYVRSRCLPVAEKFLVIYIIFS